jgi:mannose-1-phosphate guanylyltransferase
MYAVILAGGGGTRLWPLSTPDRPKPFLPLLADGRTLFERTLERLLAGPELPLEPARDVYVIVDGRFEALAHEQLTGAWGSLPPEHVIAEPQGRNTAAAVALATAAIERDDDDVMVVLPADHLIDRGREGVFRGVLAAAESELARGAFGIDSPLVTLGVQPARPATEYGYLIPDLARQQRRALTAYPLERFQEKPDAELAARLVARPGVAWNAGMFLWRRRAVRDALLRYPKAAPIWDVVAGGWRAGTLARAYADLAALATSIDYAVLEPASAEGLVVMGSMDVGWSDLGSWSVLLATLGCPASVSGRVVQPGQTADLEGADLLVVRDGGRLAILDGPGRMEPRTGPAALLSGARPHRGIVEALLDRCAQQES